MCEYDEIDDDRGQVFDQKCPVCEEPAVTVLRGPAPEDVDEGHCEACGWNGEWS